MSPHGFGLVVYSLLGRYMINLSKTDRCPEGTPLRASPRADQAPDVRGQGGDNKATSSYVDHCKDTDSASFADSNKMM